jgi:membrane fusion protein, multidrug efflux system
MKKILAIIIVITLICLIALLVCQKADNKMKQSMIKSENQAYSIGVIDLKKSKLVETVSGHAIIRGNPQVKVYTTGNISGLFIKNLRGEGDFVKKDEVIAYIDRNSPGDIYSEVPVLSPISGFITKLYFTDKGSKIVSTDPIAEVANTGSLKLTIILSSYDIVKVRENQNVLITSDFIPGLKIDSKVGSVTPFIDTDSMSGEATVYVNNEKGSLQIGLSVNVEIEVAERIAYVVPENVVLINGDATYVFMNENNVAKKVQVKSGYSSNGMIEISGEIKDGDQVINEGNFKLNDGDSIKVVRE